MATVVSVTRLKSSPIQGQTNLAGSVTSNEDTPLRVVFSDRTATAAEAENAAGVPAYGTVRNGRVLTSKRAQQRAEDPREWIVTPVYTVPDPRTEAAPDELDTVDGSRWAIDWAVQQSAYEFEPQYDIHNKPLVNSAGDPVTVGTVAGNDIEFAVSFVTNVVDLPGILGAMGMSFSGGHYVGDGRGAINSVPMTLTINGGVWSFEAETMRFIDFSLDASKDPSGVIFNRMIYRCRWRLGGWRRKIADKGLYTRVSPTLTGLTLPHEPIKDAKGNAEQTPRFLDGTGQLAVEGADAKILPQPPGVSGPGSTDANRGKGFELFPAVDLGTLLLWGLET